jgi:hypothetical protein
VTPEQELELRMAEPPADSVVKFKLEFPHSPKTYTYIALEAGGMWYLTGTEIGRTWNGLVSWLMAKRVNVLHTHIARTWEVL